MPVDRLAEFLDWFDARGRDAAGLAVPGAWPSATWPHLPARARHHLRQRRLLGHRPRRARGRRRPAQPGDRGQGPRARPATSRSTPRRSTTARPSTSSTTAPTSPGEGAATTPTTGSPSLYDKAVQTTMTDEAGHRANAASIGEAVGSLLRDGMPVRFTAYDGSSGRVPTDAPITLELLNQRGLRLPAHGTRRPGHGPRLRRRRPRRRTACTPATPTTRWRCSRATCASASRRPAEALALVRGLGISATSGRPPPPPQEHLPRGAGRWRACGTRCARRRGDQPPLRRVQRVLRATCSGRR